MNQLTGSNGVAVVPASSPNLEAALSYARQGFHVVPLHHLEVNRCSCTDPECRRGGEREKNVAKHPRHRQWQALAARDETTIMQWWAEAPLANIGIATGHKSDLLVLDVDVHRDKPGFTSLAALEAELGPLPPTLTTITGSDGEHRYFRWPRFRIGNSATWRGRDGIDWRADGGQVVAPPSIALAGPYVRALGLCEVAPLPQRWIDAHREFEAQRCGAYLSSRPGPASPEELAKDEDVLERALSAKDAPKFKQLWAGEWSALKKSQSEADIALCRMLAFQSPDHSRIDRLFRRSGLMRDKWERADYARNTIDKAIARCEKEKTETAHAVADGHRFHTFVRSQRNGVHASAGATTISGSDLAAPLSQPARSLPTIRVGDVPDPGPTQWLVEGLWTAGAFGIVGAEPKSWKSWLTLQIGIAVATGTPLFNRFPVRKGRVLVFSAEGGKNLVRMRTRKLCAALRIDINTIDLEVIDVFTLMLDEANHVEALRALVSEKRPELVILDPLRNMHGADENDAAATARLLTPLLAIKMEFGCAVMVVHHMAKVSNESGGRRLGQRLRGSSVLHGSVDSALYLQAKGEGTAKRVKVTAEHREAAEPEPFTIELNTLLDDGIRLQPIEAGETEEKLEIARHASARQLNRKRVVEAIKLSRNPGGSLLKSKTAVQLATGMKKQTAIAIIDDLMKDATISIGDDRAYQVGPAGGSDA